MKQSRRKALDQVGILLSELNQVKEKFCRTCSTVKPVADFHRRAASKDGLQSQCINCRKGDIGQERNAKNAVRYAVQSGLLKKPAYCELCDGLARTEAYHPDYGKPLDVQWLCPSCKEKKNKFST